MAFIIILVAGYYIWGYTGKNYSGLKTTVVPVSMISAGGNVQKGNLVAIQPYLTAPDYCDREHFFNALHPYFKKAQDSGWLQSKTIVVLPENIGSWLAFAEEKSKVYGEDSMRQAVATIVNSNIFNFIRYLGYTPDDDKIKHAFVYMKAGTMVSIYTAVFSSLAKEFKVTIAAGSIVLPEPVLDGKRRIRTSKGQLYYAAYLFVADGSILSRPVRKKIPEYAAEKSTLPDTNLLSMTRTSLGMLGLTAIDYNDSTQTPDLPARRSRALVVLNGRDKIWDVLWKGNKGFTIPANAVDKLSDTSSLRELSVNNLTTPNLHRSQAYRKLPAVSTGFTGQLWEVNYRNELCIHRPDSVFAETYEPFARQGRIVNIWVR